LSDDEINKVVDFVGTTEPQFVKELVQLKSKDQNSGDLKDKLKNREELYESAVEIVIREGRGSVSLLQRALGIGYGRAARLVDFMAEDGIVGEYNGSQAREVIVTMEQWAEMTGTAVEEVEPEPPTRRNRIVPERVDDESDGDDGGGGGGRSKGSSATSKPKPHIPVAPPAPTSNAPFVPGGPTSPTNALKGAGATALALRTLSQVDVEEDEELDDKFEAEDAFAEIENDTDTAPWETEPEAVTDEWTGARKRSTISSEDEFDEEDCDDDGVNARYESESDEDEVDDESDDEADLDDDAIVSRKRSTKKFDDNSESLSDDDADTDEGSVSDFSTPYLKVAAENESDTDEESDEEYEDEVEEIEDELEQENDEDETEEEE
jgi:hypothetical protein